MTAFGLLTGLSNGRAIEWAHPPTPTSPLTTRPGDQKVKIYRIDWNLHVAYLVFVACLLL